jgi:hypothetical protein
LGGTKGFDNAVAHDDQACLHALIRVKTLQCISSDEQTVALGEDDVVEWPPVFAFSPTHRMFSISSRHRRSSCWPKARTRGVDVHVLSFKRVERQSAGVEMQQRFNILIIIIISITIIVVAFVGGQIFGPTVQPVAHNGTMQSVGAVHPDLMLPTGARDHFDQYPTGVFIAVQDPVGRRGGSAVDGSVDGTGVGNRTGRDHEALVRLVEAAEQQLAHELGMRAIGFGHQQTAGCILVQPVDQSPVNGRERVNRLDECRGKIHPPGTTTTLLVHIVRLGRTRNPGWFVDDRE